MAQAASSKSPRKHQSVEKFPPLSQSERGILISLVKSHEKVLENKKTNKFFNDTKEKAWQKLAVEFNSYPDVCKRTEKNIRKSWENLKARTKREFAAEKKSVFETGGGKNDVSVSEEGLQIHAIVGPQIDPLENLFDDDADAISLDGDDKENSIVFSVKAHKSAKSVVQVTDSSDDDSWSFKSVPKGRKRTLTREDQMILRCRSSLLAIKHAQEVHEQRIKLMELEEQYWKKKISDECVTTSSIIL